MHPHLNRNLFLVKEHIGLLKAANNYDIYDPETGEIIMECREDSLGLFTRIFRFTEYKRMTPFDIRIRTPEGEPLVRITRGISFFLSKVLVFDEHDQPLGGFKQRFFTIGGAFNVLDTRDQPLCRLQGKWTGWSFKFITGEGIEFARVSKKWAGVGKEFFTSADNYMLQISDTVPADNPVRQLILAAVMCIDMVLKEK
jgi:uncharacterized protein YxjI